MPNLFINPVSLLLSLFISLDIQAIFFLFASGFKTDKVTDLSYSLSFIFLTLFSAFQNPSLKIPQIIIIVAIILWGFRLATYLFSRILKIKKDSRFDGTRENFWKFLSFWILQGITVWIVMIPATHLLSQNIPPCLSLATLIGLLIWSGGLILESTADSQKFVFKNNPENKNKWIQTGVWKYSRHPNYFGEMLCWWGIFTITLPYLQNWDWLTIIGPIFITFILLFVSGIPPLEKRYREKYQNNSDYQEYKRKTSLLLPLPLKK